MGNPFKSNSVVRESTRFAMKTLSRTSCTVTGLHIALLSAVPGGVSDYSRVRLLPS